MTFPEATGLLSARQGCCWSDHTLKEAFPRLDRTVSCDTAVIGGGIVGLTAALTLCQRGQSVVVLEARKIGTQVTGRSTAKVTAQHGLIYRALQESRGETLAQLYAGANAAAIDRIRQWIDAFYIACDFQPKNAYTYVLAKDRLAELEAEADTARKLGFDACVVENVPLPFPTAGALLFKNQGQFNPTRYLEGLAAAVTACGGSVFENSRGVEFERRGRWSISTDQGEVQADNIVMATNITVKSPVGYSNRTQPRMHVAMAFRATEAAASMDGIFYGIDEPTHSIRMAHDENGPLVIALGPKFSTGQDGNIAQHFLDLEDWARCNLPVEASAWRWCNEDYDTPDRMPFVGQPDPEKSPDFYVATGFNAWGISNGTAAGLMIADEISEGKHPWGSLFDPRRPVREDFHHSGESQSLVRSVEDIAIGQGGVISHGDEKLAVFRGNSGELTVFSAACTHKGCILTWNNADQTWDCPCHGSMFDKDGNIIHGPARKPLERRALPS